MKIPHLPSLLTPQNVVRLLCGAGALTMAILALSSKMPWDVLAEIGTPEKPRDFFAIYWWWASALNAILFIFLGLSVPWWLRSNATELSGTWLAVTPTPKGFFVLVLAAMTLTAAFGWQRLDHSLWDDEENSLRRVILGRYLRGDENPDGGVHLKERDWDDAFWNYTRPSNHIPQTLLSRVSLSIWRGLAQPQGLQFSETALRWPGYLAAILSVGALALLLRRLGSARAGIVAAFLLALHPWHIRYAAEARGYIFTLLFGTLMLYCLLEAINRGRWRWWLGFSASQFLLLYSYPGCLYMLVAANLGGIITLIIRHRRFRDILVFGPRLIIASVLAGMLYLQLMLPCIPQLARYLATERALGVLDARWHHNILAHFFAGIPWNNSDNPALGYPELRWMSEAHPGWQTFIAVFCLLLLVLGALRLLASRSPGWLTALVWFLPGLAVYIGARLNQNYLYEWYVIFALPGLVATVALGAEWPLRLLDRWPWGTRLLTPAILSLLVLGYALASEPARHWLITHPIQPSKDSILAVRPSLDPHDPRQDEIITVSLGMHLESYDPHILSAENVENLSEIARRADKENKPLFVITGNDLAIALDYPELRAFIRDSVHFEEVKILQGYDPTLTHTIWRYRPGSLAPVEK